MGRSHHFGATSVPLLSGREGVLRGGGEAARDGCFLRRSPGREFSLKALCPEASDAGRPPCCSSGGRGRHWNVQRPRSAEALSRSRTASRLQDHRERDPQGSLGCRTPTNIRSSWWWVSVSSIVSRRPWLDLVIVARAPRLHQVVGVLQAQPKALGCAEVPG